MSGKGFLGNMTENLQADCVQSRQAGFIQCFPKSSVSFCFPKNLFKRLYKQVRIFISVRLFRNPQTVFQKIIYFICHHIKSMIAFWII